MATGLSLHPRLEQPLYQQLFEQITTRICSGTWPSGFRLPPTRELASELLTHRNTVVRVYQELESSGFVYSAVGKGTFVVGSCSTTKVPLPTAE